MLPEDAGLGQHFQAPGHSFSLYGPTLSRQKTYLFFIPVVNWLTGRFANATLPLHWLTGRSTKHRKKSNELANERVTQILDEERCIKEQIYCKLLYFSCILFTCSVLLNCFSDVKFRAEFEAS